MKISIWNLIGTRDYVVDVTHRATLGSNRCSGGCPPNRGNITLLWLFCCPVFFLSHAPRSNHCTSSYAEWLKRRVSAQGRSFWGVTAIDDVIWGNIPQKLPQNGREEAVSSQNAKIYININIICIVFCIVCGKNRENLDLKCFFLI